MAQMKLVTQFKQMFSRFCKDGKHAVFGYWQCNRGGYDQWFSIFSVVTISEPCATA